MIKKRCIIFVFAALIAFPVISFAQECRILDGGVQVTLDSVSIRVCFLSPDIIGVRKYPTALGHTHREFSVIDKNRYTGISVDRKGKLLLLSSGATGVRLNMANGSVSFFDSTGRTLLQEKQTVFAAPGESYSGNYDVCQEFRVADEEAIWGFGQHQDTLFNRRNSETVLRQQNMEIAMPFFLSSKGYGLFWDNYSATVFKDTLGTASFKSEMGKLVDYYFINGGSPDGTIRGLRELTGRAPMLPRWAFGYWQSRERYKSQKELVNTVKKYRQLKVPLDVIVQDWKYWGTETEYWNGLQFRNPAYPDPGAMIEEVHKLHAHFVISIWPSFGPATHIYQELKENGLLFDFSTYPAVAKVYNAFSPEARDIYWKKLDKDMFSLGIDGWWMDGTEPIVKNKEGKDDQGEVKLNSLLTAYRNAFPLLTTMGVYQHQRKADPQKRVVILTRSAFVGQQRFGTIVWSGDVNSDWLSLKKQVAAGLGFSITGMPYWTTDIGGFYSGKRYPEGVKDPAFKELYVRWLQFETFLPVMRSHGTDTPREIYQFGKEGDWAYDAIRQYINLRYRLLPYLYSNAWQVASNAGTIMRPLVMDFKDDRRVWNMDDEFMFGKDFLVCPVTDSMYTGMKNGKQVVDFSRKKSEQVYLPGGARWFDFWTGEINRGGRYVKKETPVDIIPLYVKAGSVIPMGPVQQYVNEKKDSILELRIYPGADGNFTLYEDEGENYHYEKGVYSLIKMHWNDRDKILTIDDRIGEFPGMPENRVFNIVLVKEGHGTGIEQVKKVDQVIHYNGHALDIQF